MFDEHTSTGSRQQNQRFGHTALAQKHKLASMKNTTHQKKPRWRRRRSRRFGLPLTVCLVCARFGSDNTETHFCCRCSTHRERATAAASEPAYSRMNEPSAVLWSICTVKMMMMSVLVWLSLSLPFARSCIIKIRMCRFIGFVGIFHCVFSLILPFADMTIRLVSFFLLSLSSFSQRLCATYILQGTWTSMSGFERENKATIQCRCCHNRHVVDDNAWYCWSNDVQTWWHWQCLCAVDSASGSRDPSMCMGTDLESSILVLSSVGRRSYEGRSWNTLVVSLSLALTHGWVAGA